jgi:hypothetical protein
MVLRLDDQQEFWKDRECLLDQHQVDVACVSQLMLVVRRSSECSTIVDFS